jgi:hypothetical protein
MTLCSGPSSCACWDGVTGEGFPTGVEGAEASSLGRGGGEAESLRCSVLVDEERLGETDRARPLTARL